MQAGAHRIRRLSLECPSHSERAALTLRRDLSAQWPRLLPVFEAVFDRVCADGRVLHIPKLELRLDLTDASVSLDAVREQLEVQLRQWLRGQANDTVATQALTAREYAVAVVLHYLQHGNLHWHALEEASHEAASKLAELCREQAAPIITQLKALTLDTAVLFRLFQLLDTETAERYITELLAGMAPPGRTQIILVVRGLYQFAQIRAATHQCLQAMAELLRQAVRHPEVNVPRMLAQTLKQAGLLEAVVQMLKQEGPSAQLDRPAHDELAAVLSAGGAAMTRSSAAPLPSVPPVAADAVRGEPAVQLRAARVVQVEPGHAHVPESLPPGAARPVTERVAPADPAPLYPLRITNAGLVLLHPFIAPLFVATGLCTKPAKEILGDKLPQAAALLHYLARGDDDIFEFDAALLKLLLGMSPHETLLVSAGLLSESQQHEADAMLQAVIGHWPVLKNTSVGGLRQSFLQRNGLLKSQDHGWQLQVEARPYDVLLDQCPWGHSVVRLPWMKQAIYPVWR